jgi:hypothetical protein
MLHESKHKEKQELLDNIFEQEYNPNDDWDWIKSLPFDEDVFDIREDQKNRMNLYEEGT